MQVETVEIKGKEYKVHFAMQAIKEFEETANKPITQIKTTWDQFLFFYCTLKALNPDFKYTLQEFTEITNHDPQKFIAFQTLEVLADPDPFNPDKTNQVKKKRTTKQIFTLWMLLALLAVLPVLAPVIFGAAWVGASFWLLWMLIKEIGSKRGR